MRLRLPRIAALLVAAGCSDSGTGPQTQVAAVTVTAPSSALQVGQTLQLSATPRDVYGTIVPTSSATAWTSSSTTIASVTQSGVVTGNAPGSVMISARVDGVTGTYAIMISGQDAFDVFTPGLIFSPFSLTVPLGTTVRFHITGTEHNAIFNRSVPGAPPDILVVENVTLNRTFNTRGTFGYDCTVHPGMSGQVVVQ